MDQRGEDLEERLLDFAARVGKLVDALPDTRLGRHIAGQLLSSDQQFTIVSCQFNFFNRCRREAGVELV